MNLFDPVRCSSSLQEYKMTAAASHAPAEGSAQHRNTHNTPLVGEMGEIEKRRIRREEEGDKKGTNTATRTYWVGYSVC